jgi:hypothetical protein
METVVMCPWVKAPGEIEVVGRGFGALIEFGLMCSRHQRPGDGG